jgi:hypothetical protein
MTQERAAVCVVFHSSCDAGCAGSDCSNFSNWPEKARKQRVSNVSLTDEEKQEIRARIAVLELEHGDLDDIIDRIAHDPVLDQLQLRRLKKRKLSLKDQITRLEARLIPDIMA